MVVKRVSLLSVVLLILFICTLSVNADTNSNLEMAKKYEGNFYKYHTSGDWNIFSDNGVDLGEPEPLSSDVSIEYYVNPEEDYIIQYYEDDSNMSYAIWKDNTVEFLSSSAY